MKEMFFDHYRNGINLGGWLAQYEWLGPQPLTEDNLQRHFDTFITESDIRQIASLGFDHIRVPVDGSLLYDRNGDCLNKAVLSYLRKCLGWCNTSDLCMILDLHDFSGNEYGAMDHIMPLLCREDLKRSFLLTWELLAVEFRDVPGDRLTFELLNEVSDASGAYAEGDPYGEHYDFRKKGNLLWNRLWTDALSVIREIDGKRYVLAGCNGQNSVVYLKEMAVPDDPFVFYNFHYYDPQAFTHQKADFSEEMATFHQAVTYPGDLAAFDQFLNIHEKDHPEWKRKHILTASESFNDYHLMEKLLASAFSFQALTGREVYCGEFGVLNTVPGGDAAAWIRDFKSLTGSHCIGHALWNYKSLGFGILDENGRLAREVV